MIDPSIGKYDLESNTTGMYKNDDEGKLSSYREYVQNATDAIDDAVLRGIVSASDAEIHIVIDRQHRKISIKDNGCGVGAATAAQVLTDIGNSSKDYTQNRGFRGIGRLGGTSYCDTLRFITTAKGEKTKSIVTWDCALMRELLSPQNTQYIYAVDVIKAVTTYESAETENEDSHYFEVVMEGIISEADILLDEEAVNTYLSVVAPVDFNSQKFPKASEIKSKYQQMGYTIPTYRIFFGTRKLPIYKPYSLRLDTSVGQSRTKENELVRTVEYFTKTSTDGTLLYIGWLAITDFSGSIKDEKVRGIRFRKANILVGDENLFNKFFPSEGYRANKMFAGEIHVLSTEIIPNSRRDDFEQLGPHYTEMEEALTEWAGSINKKYRRGTSSATSAIRTIKQLNQEQHDLVLQVSEGAISSETKREELAKQIEKIEKKRAEAEKTVRKAIETGTFDSIKVQSVQELLEVTEQEKKKLPEIASQVVNAGYATKNDLPSSYSREVRKVYERIINVIDSYFADNPSTAAELREAIKKELSEKKK